MRFVKMHGAGNDYVYLDRFRDPLPDRVDLPALARLVSDRHTGVGADGLIVVEPAGRPDADARMRMWNADGSPSAMCGNGLRCVARYLHDRGLVRGTRQRIETGRGTLAVELLLADGVVRGVRLDMDRPILAAAAIPTTLPGDPPLDVELALDDAPRTTLRVTCVSMGNPHCVTFVERDELTDALVHGLGPRIERHPAFPERTNVEFVSVRSPHEFDMRVWERGTGETQACGSGACAALVAGALTGRLARRAVAHLPGGDLELAWSETDRVSLTGPAKEVFEGLWPDERVPRDATSM